MCCLLFFVCFDFSEFGSQKEKVEFFMYTTDFKAFFKKKLKKKKGSLLN